MQRAEFGAAGAPLVPVLDVETCYDCPGASGSKGKRFCGLAFRLDERDGLILYLDDKHVEQPGYAPPDACPLREALPVIIRSPKLEGTINRRWERETREERLVKTPAKIREALNDDSLAQRLRSHREVR